MLIYNNPGINTSSSFDTAIRDIVAGGGCVRVIDPYISLTYIAEILSSATDWQMVTDVKHWIKSETAAGRRAAVVTFINKNYWRIWHNENVHAKVIISQTKAMLGSANFTENGIFKNNELDIIVYEPTEIEKLIRWFEEIKRKSYRAKDVLKNWIEADDKTEDEQPRLSARLVGKGVAVIETETGLNKGIKENKPDKQTEENTPRISEANGEVKNEIQKPRNERTEPETLPNNPTKTDNKQGEEKLTSDSIKNPNPKRPESPPVITKPNPPTDVIKPPKIEEKIDGVSVFLAILGFLVGLIIPFGLIIWWSQKARDGVASDFATGMMCGTVLAMIGSFIYVLFAFSFN
jgi:hypothetical protein